MSEEDSDYSYVSDSDGSVGESKEVSLPESNPLLKRQLSLETEDRKRICMCGNLHSPYVCFSSE